MIVRSGWDAAVFVAWLVKEEVKRLEGKANE